MTQANYTNYILSVKCAQAQLSSLLIQHLEIGSCDSCSLTTDLNIVTAYIDIISEYCLPATEADQANNCLTPEEMKAIAFNINTILGTNLCIDFELT